MKKKLIVLGLVAGMGPVQAGYLVNSAGEVVRDGSGDCVMAEWGVDVAECRPEQVRPVTLPAPVEAEKPVVASAPKVSMPLPGEGVALTDEVAKVVQPPFVNDSVYFDTDKDTLTKASQATLNALVEKAKVMNVNGLVVQGFADIRGTQAYNKALSERRNQAVINYLNPTFKQVKVIPIPMGETQMWSAQDMQENRRVNVYLTGNMK